MPDSDDRKRGMAIGERSELIWKYKFLDIMYMVFGSDYLKAAVATMCIDAGLLYVVLTSPDLP
jgi:hypothetical protein